MKRNKRSYRDVVIFQCLLGDSAASGAQLMFHVGACIPVEDTRFLASLLLKTCLYHNCEVAFVVALNRAEIHNEGACVVVVCPVVVNLKCCYLCFYICM